MRAIQTITASRMREINRAAVLELIRQEGPISRSVIANRLQVSIPTVMRIVDELLEDGLLRDTGRKESSGGRKRPLLEFNGAGSRVVGIDLGGADYYGAVADLNGSIRYEERVAGAQDGAQASFERLVAFAQALLAHAREAQLPILGVSVGVPGITDTEQGLVKLAPGVNWTDFPLLERLAECLGLPVVIENDANLEALGELWFGSGLHANNLVLITAGSGVGAGVVINGSVYTGKNFMAGEIGYFLPDRTGLGAQFSGFGVLDQAVSISGILRRAQEKLAQAAPAQAAETTNTGQVFAAARRGETWAVEVMDETADVLAQVVAAAQVFLDPDVILLGGMLSECPDLIIQPILGRLAGALPAVPNLQASTLGYRAAVLGGIVRLTRLTADYYVVQKYS